MTKEIEIKRTKMLIHSLGQTLTHHKLHHRATGPINDALDKAKDKLKELENK